MDPMSDPDFIRIKYAIRKDIIWGNIAMSYRKALPLIGPDCAFYLYRGHDGEYSKDVSPETMPPEEC